MTHGSGGGGCVELKYGREDIDILAEIIFDGEEITVSAGSIKLQSKVLLEADPLPLAKIESGVSVPSLFLSWLISGFWCFNGVTKSLLVVFALLELMFPYILSKTVLG